jgi:hypothetical protein
VSPPRIDLPNGSGPDWLERLAALDAPHGPVPLPARADAPALLERLRLAPEDAAALLANWPSEDWLPELTWLLERVYALVHADLGGARWLAPGPALPATLGPASAYLYAYVYLALVPAVRAYHAAHDVPDEVSWATLADLGRHLASDRLMAGAARAAKVSWLTFHVRGGLYELGRLQFQRGTIPAELAAPAGLSADGHALSVHIPSSGPLTPEACAASFARARPFFERCFPEEDYCVAYCDSWLLDPQLAEYLDADSNIVRFQRSFELVDGSSDARFDVMRFVFHTVSTPLEELTPSTTLERAIVAHLEAGREWYVRQGWLRLPS